MGEEGERAVSDKKPYRQSGSKALPPNNVGKSAPNHLHGDLPATGRATIDTAEENDHVGLFEEAAFRSHRRASAEEDARGQASSGETMLAVVDAMTPLTRIDLSRHQICDDGAAALALALRNNVRVEVNNLLQHNYTTTVFRLLAFDIN